MATKAQRHKKEIKGWVDKYHKTYPRWCNGFVPLHSPDGCKPEEWAAFDAIEIKYNPKKLAHSKEWGKQQATLIDGHHTGVGGLITISVFLVFMIILFWPYK